METRPGICSFKSLRVLPHHIPPYWSINSLFIVSFPFIARSLFRDRRCHKSNSFPVQLQRLFTRVNFPTQPGNFSLGNFSLPRGSPVPIPPWFDAPTFPSTQTPRILPSQGKAPGASRPCHLAPFPANRRASSARGSSVLGRGASSAPRTHENWNPRVLFSGRLPDANIQPPRRASWPLSKTILFPPLGAGIQCAGQTSTPGQTSWPYLFCPEIGHRRGFTPSRPGGQT